MALSSACIPLIILACAFTFTAICVVVLRVYVRLVVIKNPGADDSFIIGALVGLRSASAVALPLVDVMYS
jgi:hypothetical protein